MTAEPRSAIGGRRARLLGAEPRPQPARAAGGRLVAASATSTETRSSGSRALSGRPATTALRRACSRTRRSTRSRSPRRSSTHYELAEARARCRQARLRREAARGVDRGGGRARASSPTSPRPRADAGPHVPLQPAGQHDPRPDPSRRARRASTSISTSRVNLGLHQPDVSVDLGPRPARLLDPSLLARRDADARRGDEPGLHHARRRPTSRSSTSSIPSGTIAHVELSWLAPSKLRRTTIIGSQKMVVYDDTSTEPVRVFDSGATLIHPRPSASFASLSHRRHLSPRIEVAEPLHSRWRTFARQSRQVGSPAHPWHRTRCPRVIEAVDRSLGSDGAPSPVRAQLATR